MLDLEDNYWDFLLMKQTFPGAKYVEILPDWRSRLHMGEVGIVGTLLQKELSGSRTVLDVGAGDRAYKDVLSALGIQADYSSADTDKRYKHEFSDFMSVEQKFDAILMFELLEHLPLEVGLGFIAHAYQCLSPGGVLIISTPNAHHANHVWRVELTHVRPWPGPDLYAVLQLSGFSKVEILRQYSRTAHRRIVAPFTRVLARIMEIDHAQTTLAIARRT